MTDSELKIIQKEKWRQIFPASMIFLFLFLILFIYSSLKNEYGTMFLVLLSFSLVISIISFLMLVRKYNEDLKIQKVDLIEKIVEDKVYKVDYEPGSASIPVNLLSLFFIKSLLKRKMKEVHLYYLVIEGEKLYIDQNQFEKAEVSKPIIIRQTSIAKVFTGLQIQINKLSDEKIIF